jgi:hypothetical protein
VGLPCEGEPLGAADISAEWRTEFLAPRTMSSRTLMDPPWLGFSSLAYVPLSHISLRFSRYGDNITNVWFCLCGLITKQMTPSRRQSTGSSRRTYCGCLGSCCSVVRSVTRWWGTWSPTLGGSPTRPCMTCPRSVGATLFLRARTGACARGCWRVVR